MKKSHDLSVRSSREGLGFYAKPLLVPQRITAAQALESFDRRQSRIYIVPTRIVVYPEDVKARLGYSYFRDSWWQKIIPKAELKQWDTAGLFEIWDRILAHARRQCVSVRERSVSRNTRHLDFYHFVEPEIQRIGTASPDKYAYELRYSPERDYYFFNHYTGKR